MTLKYCGRISLALGDYAGARACLEESIQIDRELGHRRSEAEGLAWLGLVSHRLGDDRAAQEYGQQALRIAQEIGRSDVQGYALSFLGQALAGLEEWDRAADAYRQSLDILRELVGQHDQAVLCLAGLARVALRQGTCPACSEHNRGELVGETLALAQAHMEEILSYLESGPLLPYAGEDLGVYLSCYQVLQASGDSRAQEVLSNAHALLQERAAKIDDEELRRSYLENVAAHREIVAAWEEMSHP